MLREPIRAATEPGAFLAERYRAVREATVRLAKQLTVEDQVVQPCEEASPTKWHLGHTTWFFERFVLGARLPDYSAVDDRYDRVFNSYYYTVGPMHPRADRGTLSRPTVAQIHDYRSRIDDAAVASARVSLRRCRARRPRRARPEPRGAASRAAADGREASPVREHARGRLRRDGRCAARDEPQCRSSFASSPPASPRSAPIRPGFAFDNERPRHREWLEAHLLANRLVTNGEYREFIRAGGYTTPQLWLADGWTTVNRRGWNRPLCWSQDLEREYTLGGWRTLDSHAPVCHVSFYEAAAFAAWAGARLPTEAEWENAAQTVTPIEGNLRNTGWLHPAAATTGSRNRRLLQLWGDVWEWCASGYRPYPRFRPLKGSLGEYNGKFMCNQWVARGGSCVTPPGHIRASYRNFFYPHDRWQFLGIRLAKDD